MASNKAFKAGPARYMAEAFKNRWNLLALVGASGLALLSPWPDAALLLVAASEVGFLGMLTASPRFRQAIDALDHKRERPGDTEQAAVSLQAILGQLPPAARERFLEIRSRVQNMRSIAQNVRGRVGDEPATDDAQTAGLDRLLWTHIRLLLSQAALQEFLDSTHKEEIVERRDALQARLAAEGETLGERMRRSLAESLAAAELRLENYQRAEDNATFLAIEVERIEQSIHALVEMAVNRHDPDSLAAQVNATVDSMRRTEETLAELQSLTGLTENMAEAPAILDRELDHA